MEEVATSSAYVVEPVLASVQALMVMKHWVKEKIASVSKMVGC